MGSRATCSYRWLLSQKGGAQIFKEKAEADNVEGGPRFYWASPFLYLGILAFGLDD